ncbi:MAG TPA: RES family NAD+ phosphorylase, partial [Gemmatimonas sp.]|nr:RES family NAD+ phosphorylase [Gemmatimonas sp.]
RLHDVRGQRTTHPELYRSEDYSAPQMLATRLRSAGSEGVVYGSVRHPGGQCAAVFRPRLLSNCRQAEHLGYVWDGVRINAVLRKSAFT